MTPLERRRFEDGPELFFELDDSDESVAVVVQAWDDDGTFDRPDAYDISSVAGEFDGSTLSGNPCASLLSKSFDPLDLKAQFTDDGRDDGGRSGPQAEITVAVEIVRASQKDRKGTQLSGNSVTCKAR